MTERAGEGGGVRPFFSRLWMQLQEDEIFFMASAIAFNLLVAAIPLVLLGVGLTGFVLSAQVHDPAEAIVALLADNLPPAASETVRAIVSGALDQRTGFTVFGAIFFVWLATRLIGTLRVALRRIFAHDQTRGIIRGKVFDARVVVIGVVLLTLNLGVTVAFPAAVAYGGELFRLGVTAVGIVEFVIGYLVALVSIWMLFFIIYRYLPPRRLRWGTAVVAATFSALIHEVLKEGFSWYAIEIADYSSTWGNLATVVILIFWIYYEALVFILGGEVAQAYTLGKAVTVQSYASSESPALEDPEGPV